MNFCKTTMNEVERLYKERYGEASLRLNLEELKKNHQDLGYKSVLSDDDNIKATRDSALLYFKLVIKTALKTSVKMKSPKSMVVMRLKNINYKPSRNEMIQAQKEANNKSYVQTVLDIVDEVMG